MTQTKTTAPAVGGHVDEINPPHVRGWARDAGGKGPIEVEVVVDRRRVFVALADRARPDLADSGLGDCAFSFSLPETLDPKQLAEIIIRPRGSLMPLPGGYVRFRETLPPYLYVEDDEECIQQRAGLLGNACRGAILFTARVGCTHLVNMLQQHPDVMFFSEPLHLLAQFGSHAQLGWAHDLYLTPHRVEYSRVVSNPRLVGFSTKLEAVESEDGLAGLLKFYGARILRLYRRNILKQVVSHVRAKALMRERGAYNLKVSAQDRALDPFAISPAELMGGLVDYEEAERAVDSFLYRLRPEHALTIAYEELVADKASALDRVCTFFGLTKYSAKEEFIKVTPDSLRVALSNFDEVWHAFRGTRYAWMLED